MSAALADSDEVMAAAPAQLVSRDEDGNELTPEDIEDQLVEQLAEKRSSTRLGALQRLIDKLQLHYSEDFVAARLDTLQLYLLNSVKKGDAAEVVLACRALSLLALTLGPDGEKLVQAATPLLHTYLINTSKSPAGRGAVADALGFVTFVCGLSDADTLTAMAHLVEALQHGHPPEQVTTHVWEAWGLLASSLPTSRQAGELADKHLGALVRFLDDESIDVRTAAGENIAMLISARQEIEAERADQDEEEEEEEEKSDPMSDAAAAASPAASAASAASDGDGTDLPSLIAKLRALSTDGNRHRARKERSAQRKSFRDILHSVEHGDVPSETLKIGKDRHEFEGWSHVSQLAAVRDVLGKGLNVHFASNPLLMDIFSLVVEGADFDAAGSKEAARAHSKQKAIDNFHAREKGRKKKQAMINPLGEE